MTVRSVARAAPCHVKNARRLPSSPPTSCPNCHTLTHTWTHAHTHTHTRSCQPAVTMHLLSDRILISGLTWKKRERKREICRVEERCCGRLGNVDAGDGRRDEGKERQKKRERWGGGGWRKTLVDTVATEGGTVTRDKTRDGEEDEEERNLRKRQRKRINCFSPGHIYIKCT